MTKGEKNEAIKGLDTAVLRRILGSLTSPENRERSPEFPLGGLVHIEGIGQVPVWRLREELATRDD